MTESKALSGRARGNIPFAPEGWRFIIPTAILSVAFWLLSWTVTSAVLFILLLFMLNFFRDPERDIPSGDGLYVCPADGKVIRAEMMDTGHQRVDIFMNIKVGDMVVAGSTVIACKRESDAESGDHSHAKI